MWISATSKKQSTDIHANSNKSNETTEQILRDTNQHKQSKGECISLNIDDGYDEKDLPQLTIVIHGIIRLTCEIKMIFISSDCDEFENGCEWNKPQILNREYRKPIGVNG